MTISLVIPSWNDYWDKFKNQVVSNINSFNTQPDEIVIVSDKKCDTSGLECKNIKNILIDKPNGEKIISVFRNVGVSNSSYEWIVFLDLDDHQFPNYLDNLDNNSDIHAFSFIDQKTKNICLPDETSLLKRFNGISDNAMIPGTSAIKKSLFNRLRYELGCYEDDVFYSVCHTLKAKVSYDKSIRFSYSGFHLSKKHKELHRVGNIYKKVLSGDRNIYCFWFSKDISPNRLKSIEIIKKFSKSNMILLNEEDFYSYENSEIPIHKSFKYLSDVDKSNYARCYMMYFYGEGYSDIKPNEFDWTTYFDQLFQSNYDAAGYPEKSMHDIANFWQKDKKAFNYVSNNYKKFAGNGHYIFKPKTETAFRWLTKIHLALDEKNDLLILNPGTYHPRAIYGGVQGDDVASRQYQSSKYPLYWTEIAGKILHTMQYEDSCSKFLLNMPYVNTKNYR